MFAIESKTPGSRCFGLGSGCKNPCVNVLSPNSVAHNPAFHLDMVHPRLALLRCQI